MKKRLGFVVLVAAVTLSACQKVEVSPWFEGAFDAALSEAGARDTLVFVDFYSDT